MLADGSSLLKLADSSLALDLLAGDEVPAPELRAAFFAGLVALPLCCAVSVGPQAVARLGTMTRAIISPS